MPLHSICMLCSNDSESAKSSIESLLSFCEEWDSEIVVVDNMSTDGSWEILKRFGRPVMAFQRRCTRGTGRNLALHAARGRFIIAQLDCDDTFEREGLGSILQLYHDSGSDRIMMTKRSSEHWYAQEPVTIGSKDLLMRIGGWRDVNWYEDWDLWARAAAAGVYSFVPYPERNPIHRTIKLRWDRRLNFTKKARTTFEQYRDSVRIGRAIVRHGERLEPNLRGVERGLILALASASVKLRRENLVPVPNPYFYEYSASARGG